MTTTYLDQILVAHREAAAGDDRLTGRLLDAAREVSAARDFRDALISDEGVAVIGEVKRRSPSRGDLFPDLDAAVLAGQYESGGVSCLSVLTDEQWFGGSVDDLRAARSATALPVLRKDFTVHPHDVLDARIMGADCVLLIVAALDAVELRDFHDLAVEIGLDALVEIHDEAELEAALAVDATLVGVNQRDLVTFEVDTARAVRIAPQIPAGVVRVAESGVRSRADVVALGRAGYDAVLVGETLVTSGDPTGSVRALRRD